MKSSISMQVLWVAQQKVKMHEVEEIPALVEQQVYTHLREQLVENIGPFLFDNFFSFRSSQKCSYNLLWPRRSLSYETIGRKWWRLLKLCFWTHLKPHPNSKANLQGFLARLSIVLYLVTIQPVAVTRLRWCYAQRVRHTSESKNGNCFHQSDIIGDAAVKLSVHMTLCLCVGYGTVKDGVTK